MRAATYTDPSGQAASVLEMGADVLEAGLVARTAEEGPPVSVSYTLTGAGRELLPALEQIGRWAERHLTTRGVRELGHT